MAQESNWLMTPPTKGGGWAKVLWTLLEPLRRHQQVKQLKAAAKWEAAMFPGPVGTPQAGGDPMGYLQQRRRSGRAATILAGDTEPLGVGKRTLLG